MPLITALALSIGILGAIATYLFLTFGMALIWAAFIGWATFFHCGGKEAGFGKAVVHLIFGAIMALIALILVTQISVPIGNAWPAICVGVTVFILVFAASSHMLSDIPASVYGYAAVAALFLAGGKNAVTAASLDNPFVSVVIALVVGAIFGYISEKIAGALTAKA